MGKEIPKEVSDPEWLVNELDRTNELICATEAGHIDDLQAKDVLPNTVVADEPKDGEDYATPKLRMWEELAKDNKQWLQW
jgi:hypothetical protein